MAITTLDGIVAGLQAPRPILRIGAATEAVGVPHSHWYSPGTNGAGVAPSSGVNGGSHTGPIAGQIVRNDPGAGNAYLARWAASATLPCTLLLCDRLWTNSGLNVTLTTAQAITPAALPARDRTGTTNGDDVLAAIEWSATGGAGVPLVTLTYTDQSGNAGATGTFTGVATPVAGTFEIFNLAAGDTGVRAPTSYIANATRTSGTMHLVLFRILAQLEITSANIGNAIDALTGGMPQIFNGSVPFIVQIPTATTATTVMGQYVEAHG